MTLHKNQIGNKWKHIIKIIYMLDNTLMHFITTPKETKGLLLNNLNTFCCCPIVSHFSLINLYDQHTIYTLFFLIQTLPFLSKYCYPSNVTGLHPLDATGPLKGPIFIYCTFLSKISFIYFRVFGFSI